MTKKDTQGTNDIPGRRRRQNMAASARNRLTTLAHMQGEGTEYMLTRYVLERLLYCLGKSAHAGAFILKGALLFALWEDHPTAPRPTWISSDSARMTCGCIEQVFRELCAHAVEDVGHGVLAHSHDVRLAFPFRSNQHHQLISRCRRT